MALFANISDSWWIGSSHHIFFRKEAFFADIIEELGSSYMGNGISTETMPITTNAVARQKRIPTVAEVQILPVHLELFHGLVNNSQIGRIDQHRITNPVPNSSPPLALSSQLYSILLLKYHLLMLFPPWFLRPVILHQMSARVHHKVIKDSHNDSAAAPASFTSYSF
ncbi:hypothetical protein ACFE04_019699 [Oxalis oulophora]